MPADVERTVLLVASPDGGPPLSANQFPGLGLACWNRRVREWRAAGASAWREEGLAGRRLRPPVCVTAWQLVPVAFRGRPQDTGNCYPTVKAVVDGLVDAGAFPDDTGETVAALTLLAASTTAGGAGLVVQVESLT